MVLKSVMVILFKGLIKINLWKSDKMGLIFYSII
jgi:hypothetical protein